MLNQLKKNLFYGLACYMLLSITQNNGVNSLNAQMLFTDFEGTTAFGAFGDNTGADVITTDVLEICKGPGSEVWAGAAWGTTFDLTSTTELCFNVNLPNPGNVLFKVEGPFNWEQAQAYTGNGSWQTLCYDLTQMDQAGAGTVATGNVFTNVVVFPDFGEGNTEECYLIESSDFDPAGFGAFGTNTGAGPVTNNTLEICKGAGSPEWAGAAWGTTADLTNFGEVCIDVSLPNPGNVLFKLEGPFNWEQSQAYTGNGEWQTLCYDLNQMDGANTGTVAAGNVFTNVVLFPDFGEPSTEECYRFDNISFNAGGPPPVDECEGYNVGTEQVCPDGFEQTIIYAQDYSAPPGEYAPFDGVFGGGFATAAGTGNGEGLINIDAGTANFFVGLSHDITNAIPTNDLSDLYMYVDLCVSGVSNYPIALDFKLEDALSDAGTGANLLNFATTLNADGTMTIGGSLADAVNTGFSFTPPYKLVIALADFSGNATPETITLNFDNLQFFSCAPPPAGPCDGYNVGTEQSCPDGFEQTVLYTQDFSAPPGPENYTSFDGVFGGGFATATGTGNGEGLINVDAGTANFFVGQAYSVTNVPPTTDLSQLYMNIDLCVSGVSNYPIALDFKLEDANSDAGTGANLLNFATTLNADGTMTIGGALSGAVNTGFSFTPPYTLVVALADFSGNATPEEIILNFDNLQFYSCAPMSTCAISNVTAVGGTGECNPDDNTFSQTIEVEYQDPPAGGALSVNGGFFPVTGSPQQITLSGLPANGQGIEVNAFFTSDPNCFYLGSIPAPAPCFDFPVDDCNRTVFASNDFNSAQFNSDGLFGFEGDFGGGNFGINGGEIVLDHIPGTDYFYVGWVYQIYIPGGLAAYPDAQMLIDANFNQAGSFEFRLESMTDNWGGVTGSNEFGPTVTTVGAYDTYGGTIADISGSADLTSEYYQVVFAGTSGGFGNDDFFEVFVDNFLLASTAVFSAFDLEREGALFANFANADGDEIYTWYDENNAQVAQFTGTPYYSPSELGSYYVIVTDPNSGCDTNYISNPRTITELNGCCELDD